MKRFWLSIMAALLVTAIAVPAFAWEFSLTGEFQFRLRYLGRTGTADLFGDANVQDTGAMNIFDSSAASRQNGTATAAAAGPNWYSVINGTTAGTSNSNYVGFAGPNIYQIGFHGAASGPTTVIADSAGSTAAGGAGVAVVRGGYSRYGSDVLYNDMKLTMHPSFRVNNAIRVHGVYTVGGFRNKYVQSGRDGQGFLSTGAAPFERFYMSKTSESAYNTAALGSWEQLRATIQWPLGTLSIGIKDFPFGTGATYSQNLRSDTFVNIIPYGPFRFIYGVWMAEGSKTGATSYNTIPDKDTKNDFQEGLLIDYNQGPVNFGLGYIISINHANRYWGLAGALDPNATVNNANSGNSAAFAAATAAWASDSVAQMYTIAGKFNNGRFFTNAEYHWVTSDTTYVGHYPVYIEGYKSFLEAGVLAGPAKLSLMWSQVSGPVLNNGNITKRYSAAPSSVPINYQVLEPYSFLIFPTYGGGNNTYNPDGTGQASDAIILAGRLDYATAANLNLWGSFLYAKRLEKYGTYAGQYNSALTSTAGTATPVGAYSALASSWVSNNALSANATNAQLWKSTVSGAGITGVGGLNPYVDDDLIGWEAQGGVSWKLLEGMTMDFAYSYWQPGNWFNQAYRAVTHTPNGLSGQDMWMLSRSAIQAIRGSFTIDF